LWSPEDLAFFGFDEPGASPFLDVMRAPNLAWKFPENTVIKQLQTESTLLSRAVSS
jgi:hypothetical protein